MKTCNVRLKEYKTADETIEIRYSLSNCDPYGTISVEICGIRIRKEKDRCHANAQRS